MTIAARCQKELAKAETQHVRNLKMYYARLERWAREARSKKPPRPGLVLKRHDKNQEFKFECVKSVMVMMFVSRKRPHPPSGAKTNRGSTIDMCEVV